jgi:F0F1-type ATP synthase assembly protein I
MSVKQSPNNDAKKSSQSLMRYMGLATQFFVSIGVGLWLGSIIDDYFSIKAPLFIWVLPLLIVVSSLIKIIIDTNKKKK